MVASDGEVFAFGDTHFAGGCPGIGGCSGTAVAVMPDASGNGYWLVSSSGHVFTFEDATPSAIRTAFADGLSPYAASGGSMPYPIQTQVTTSDSRSAKTGTTGAPSPDLLPAVPGGPRGG